MALRARRRFLLVVELQLVLDGPVDHPDEVHVPAEQEDQETLPLREEVTSSAAATLTEPHGDLRDVIIHRV